MSQALQLLFPSIAAPSDLKLATSMILRASSQNDNILPRKRRKVNADLHVLVSSLRDAVPLSEI
jgi:hypothetical protein